MLVLKIPLNRSADSAEFVSPSTRWAHLDIMGSNPTTRSGRPEGGEATGMRALYAYIRRRYG